MSLSVDYNAIIGVEAPQLSEPVEVEPMVSLPIDPATVSGLTPNLTYFNNTTPIYLSNESGQTILSPVVKPSLSIVDTNDNVVGFIGDSGAIPKMLIGGFEGIVLDPNGPGYSGTNINITSPATEYALIQPGLNSQQLFMAASQPVFPISLPGSTTLGIGRNSAGYINWVTVTSAGLLRLQFDLPPGQDVLPNTLVTFLLNPASVGTVEFGDEGATIAGPFTPSNAGAGKVYRIDIFTPDGNTYYAINQQ